MCGKSLILSLADRIPYEEILVMCFWEENNKNDVFSVHHLRRHLRSVPVSGDVNFDHLLTVMSVKFHHSKITVFSFCN